MTISTERVQWVAKRFFGVRLDDRAAEDIALLLQGAALATTGIGMILHIERQLEKRREHRM